MTIKREFSRIIMLQFVILVLLTMVHIPAYAQEDGLVAEWHFDEGAGNVVKDSSGNGNDGTIYGATWVDGKFDKALSFDGVNDYVDLSSLSSQTYPLTIELWVKPDTSAPIGLFDSASGKEYVIRNYDSGYVEWWNADPHVTLNLAANTWAYLAFVFWYDGNRHIDYFKNGVLQTSVTGGKNSELAWTKFMLGNINSGSAGWYDGQIDEIRIYNRALTAEEIKDHYEHGPTGLSITKTATPQSIKQSQTTTITLTVKNAGSTEISDIEIADVIPKDLTLIDGETTKTYASLSPKDSRQFQYSVQINEAGTFNLGEATVSYADNKGNYQIVKSKPISIEVIPSLIEGPRQTPSKKSDSNAQSASVLLTSEKIDIELGEDAILKLSAVSLITKPKMSVQVIIGVPSGVNVTATEFSQTGTNQYTSKYDLEPGDNRDIEVKIRANHPGSFNVTGRILYYFGGDVSTGEDHTKEVTINVRPKELDVQTPVLVSTQKSPGFEIIISMIILLIVRFSNRYL